MSNTIPSITSPLPPDAPLKVVVASQVTLTLLSNAARTAKVPVFNQAQFASLTLPIAKPSGEPRTLQSSGCGLMTWTSAMAAAGCVVPKLEGGAFTKPAGAPPIDPASLLQYLQDWCALKSPSDPQSMIRKVFAPDGRGALNNDAEELAAALNDLLAVSQPETKGALTTSAAAPNAPYGQEVSDLTSHLDSGEMAILAVAFLPIDQVKPPRSKDAGDHQVLAVGHARAGSKTFYLICDSGFDEMSPYPLLARFGGPVPLGDALPFAATPFHAGGKGTRSGGGAIWRIVRYRKLQGIRTFTGLTAVRSA